MHVRSRHFATLAFSALALATSACLHAQEAPPATASEWGGMGLLQTPSARMADDGEISFTASHNSPYSRYNLTMQPFPWLEGSFRYINVANIRYGATSVSGDQNYKDKSIDFKLRLWEESRWLPEVAFGIRDLGGTGLFSSEYLVANKRFGPVDASLGFATGYIGNRGDLGNPLSAIDDRFDVRPTPTSDINNAGKFGLSSMFRGRVGVFGGISYQTPWEPLLVKVEYDGNDYKNEPRRNNLPQNTPVNVGLVYSLNRNVQFTAAWERGDAAMFAITLRGNPGRASTSPKPFDPAPESLKHTAANVSQPRQGVDSATLVTETTVQPPQSESTSESDDARWAEIAAQLQVNAGFRVEKISRRGTEVIVTGHQLRYFHTAKGLGRASRILHNDLDPSIEWFTFATSRLGMPIVDTTINRQRFVDYTESRADLDQLKLGIEVTAPAPVYSDTLYRAPLQRYGGGFNVSYKQNVGGPDGFILYQVSANYTGSFFFTPGVWITGTASGNVLNNYDKFKYDAPSRLPRVRTDLRQYTTTSDFTVPNLQLTAAHQFGRDLYGMAYAGYLEWMYAGVGAEVLYRPFGEAWAIGANLNWVKQRDYDQLAGLRDYTMTTGHASLYYAFDQEQRIVGSVSAGRYLAGDYGATVNLARAFPNGVTMGAYATKTNVSARDFGEGSFDKGIYFSIPFDTILPRSTRARAAVVWNPLVRDGGAMLGRKYTLYGTTSERDTEFFYENLRHIAD
jgi:hypothetical protein